MNTSSRWMRLALYTTAAIVALASILVISAHDKAGPHKKLFGKRWHYDAAAGITLDASPGWFLCDGASATCQKKWGPALDAALAEWNAQPTSLQYALQPEQDPDHDVNVIILDVIPDLPGVLGVDLTFDVNGDLCPLDACTVWYEEAYLSDDLHTGPYGTTTDRKTTVVHELGHGLSLAHESVNADHTLHYPCGLDDTGAIPHSVMAYNCIDPVDLGGLGESFIQKWDVCGVNHAYHDPTIGYAYCEVASSTDPDGAQLGDADCNGSVTPIDAAVILQLDVGLLSALPCPANADANDDGVVTVIDAQVILQFDAGFLPSLPP